MRHPHYKLLPHRERARHRVPANFPAVYLQARRRGRASRFDAPARVPGLKLWLDAALGLTGAWAAAHASGSVWADYSSSAGYFASGYDHAIRVYPFKTVLGVRVYSAAYLELQVTDDSSAQFYYLNWSWNAVSGAEGYRVLKSDTGSGYTFDFFLDVTGAESFVDTGAGIFAGGASVLPLDSGAADTGDAIIQWNDMSRLANHATPSTGATCALFQPGIVNGRPVLRFGSSAGYTTPLALNTPCTVFAVYALNGAGDNARRAVQGSNNWMVGPYGPPHDLFNGADFTGGPNLTRGVFVAQAAWQNGSASRNFVNGAFVGSALGAGTGPGVLGLGIGGMFAEPLDGDLAEVIAYDSALSTTTWRTCGTTSPRNTHSPDMALTLIKEDGTGKSDANSYAAVADGDAYHDGHLYAADWTGASSGTKAVALVMATRLIDAYFQFRGFKTHDTQALQWPREFARDDDALRSHGLSVLVVRDEYFASNAVPKLLLDAVIETAREFIKANRADDPDGEGLASMTLTGTLSMTFDKKDRAPVIPHVAQAMLSKLGEYLKRNTGAVRLVRT